MSVYVYICRCKHNLYECTCISYLTPPPLGQDMTQSQFFKQSLTGFNSEFSFSKTSCLTKAEKSSLPYYLPIAGGRIIGFIPFPRVLVLCEMQSVSSRIWTRIAMSISYDDNHYTSVHVYRCNICICRCKHITMSVYVYRCNICIHRCMHICMSVYAYMCNMCI